MYASDLSRACETAEAIAAPTRPRRARRTPACARRTSAPGKGSRTPRCSLASRRLAGATGATARRPRSCGTECSEPARDRRFASGRARPRRRPTAGRSGSSCAIARSSGSGRSRTARWPGSRSRTATALSRLTELEDYTNKYKGEQVEVALFGGEYQEGVLTAYCSIEDVPHIELNGHILVPLQNVASLHCSSRCDAPEPDWPPRGLDRRRAATTTATPSRACGAPPRNEHPEGAGCSSRSSRAAFGRAGLGRWAAIGRPLSSLLRAFLSAAAVYGYADRALLGMLGARPVRARRGSAACARRSSACRPKLGVVPAEALPASRTASRARSSAGRGPRGASLAVSTRPARRAAAGRARRRARARARARRAARRARRRPSRSSLACLARRAVPHRRLVAAGAARSSSARSRPRSCTCCSRRRREFAADRVAAELCGSPARARRRARSASTRPASSSRSGPVPQRSRSTR